MQNPWIQLKVWVNCCSKRLIYVSIYPIYVYIYIRCVVTKHEYLPHRKQINVRMEKSYSSYTQWKCKNIWQNLLYIITSFQRVTSTLCAVEKESQYIFVWIICFIKIPTCYFYLWIGKQITMSKNVMFQMTASSEFNTHRADCQLPQIVTTLFNIIVSQILVWYWYNHDGIQGTKLNPYGSKYAPLFNTNFAE